MFIRKFLKPNQVDEVNAKGRFIKVMNCEGVFRIRVLSQGRAIVDTDAAAGFDIQTNELFDFIEITSDIEQKLQLWASEHKLSYDALSTKASRSNSFVVDHFGQSQQVLQYDPLQSSAKISGSGAGFWVGGEGVNSENGIFIKQGDVYTHNSAAPLHVFVNAMPDRYFSNDGISKIEVANGVLGDSVFNKSFSAKETGNFDVIITDLNSGVANNIGRTFTVTGAIVPFMDGFATIKSPKSIKVFNVDGTTKSYGNPLDIGGFDVLCLVSVGEQLFMLGRKGAGEVNKIISFFDGVYTELECPVGIQQESIRKAFRDWQDDSLWLIADSGKVFVSSDGLLSVNEVVGLNVGAAAGITMSFSQKYAGISKPNDFKVVSKKDLSFESKNGLVPISKGAVIIGEQWLGVSDSAVYSSNDEFKSYSLAYENGESITELPYAFNDSIYMEEKSSKNGVKIIKGKLSINLDNPKAKFRVFKESF